MEKCNQKITHETEDNSKESSRQGLYQNSVGAAGQNVAELLDQQPPKQRNPYQSGKKNAVKTNNRDTLGTHIQLITRDNEGR